MVSFSWPAAVALIAFSALQCAAKTETQIAEEKLTPIKEIESVKISGADDKSPLTRHPDKIFVEFSHRGSYRGRSLPLKNRDEASCVALPLLATEEGMMEPVKCKIKRDRRFFRFFRFLPDKTLFTVDLDLREGDSAMSIVRDLSGKDTGARIELRYFITEYVASTFCVEGSKVNPPKKMDFYFKGLVIALDFIVHYFDVGGTESLKKPVDFANPNLPTSTSLDGLVEYPKADEFRSMPKLLKHGFSIVNWVFPLTNKNNPVQDRATLRNDIRINKLGTAVVKPMEGRWVAPLSDASMHRLFFSKMGMSTTRTVNEMDKYGSDNKYVADMTLLSDLAYRDNFENIGCKVYFNKDGNITLIEDNEDNDSAVYRPGEPLWDWAKLKARSACFVELSLEHLLNYHLLWGNVPGMALRKFLQPRHPLRIALTPHFFNTHWTCANSRDQLIAEYGPLGRALPFEYKEGYKKVLKLINQKFRFKTWPEQMEENGMLEDELHVGATDGVGLHKIMMDYVSNLVDEIYPTIEEFEADDDIHKVYKYLSDKLEGTPSEFSMPNFKLVWGEVLFRVTGLHSSIGNTAIVAMEPFFVNFRLDKNDKGVVTGSREVLSTVSTITGLTLPNEYPRLAQNWTHVLHDSDSNAHAQLQSDLIVQGKEIDDRNKARRFKNRDFHPDVVAISILS